MRKGQIETRQNNYTTLDAYISAFLSLKGFTPELVSHGGKVVFHFKDSPELQEALTDYNIGATVEAARFALMVKDLKGRIYGLRRKTNPG